ncbi:hypothetical protein CPB86DRAFT_818452 [Serendipita vermifera]|nr:hypothetical protein CPB86DRAFT_818452 [Serendipita vermifera]
MSIDFELFIRDSCEVNIDHMMPMFLIPSMREIRVVGPWGGPKLPQMHQYKFSNVEHLSLIDSDVHLDSLAELLRLPRNLKSFTCHGSSNWSNDDAEDPELTWSGSEGWSGEFTVWSFSQFIHLVSLRIDYFLLPDHAQNEELEGTRLHRDLEEAFDQEIFYMPIAPTASWT